MLRSMTGFGKSAAVIGGKNFTVEVRSLNSKYLDLNLKIPAELRDKELDFRNLLSDKVMRGKVELAIDNQAGATGGYTINKSAFRQYYNELETLADELDANPGNLFDLVLKIPDVLSSGGEQLGEESYAKLLKLVEEAVGRLDDFRQREGKQIEADICKRVQTIHLLSGEVAQIEGGRKDYTRERLKQKLSELTLPREVDETRLEQEVLLYAERFDITEELVRLASHCKFFSEVLNDHELSKGKKLSFIAQEIGREINTLGSKANDASLQKFVVEMKEELEKIKEQVNNVL